MHNNKNGKERKAISRKAVYGGAALLLIAGFALGALFGSTTNLAGWLGSGLDDNGFEEAKPQLEQQLRQEKKQEIMAEHRDDLREDGDVETNLDVIGEDDKNAAVAVVNGEKITKEELLELEEQEKQQLMMMGMDPESEEVEQMIKEARPEILDNLIGAVLIRQQAEEKGIAPGEEEVEEYYRQLARQYGGEEMLEQQLDELGITKEEIKEDLAEHLLVEAYTENYLEENLDEDALDFSEEELRERYEIQKEQMQQMG